ncbi:MAG: chemotaxis protein CheW [Myxococcaceae bacterium]|nr:chemotaxis protein CheW [Myxococcaceae bacterium]
MKLTWAQTLERFFFSEGEPVPAAWEEAPASIAPRTVVPPETEQRFLAFRLENETFAIPVETVREVVRVPLLTPVPRAPTHLLGVMNLRGEVLPVYDIKPRLQLTPAPVQWSFNTPPPRQARFIVLADHEGDLCIWVDQVEDVVSLKASGFESAPMAVGERAMIQGLARDAGRLYILLDVEKVTE